MKIRITIPNLNSNISGFRRFSESVRSKIKLHVIKTGINIQGQAKEVVHVDTGRLRASIDMTQNLTSNVAEVTVGSNVTYAGYHEAAYPYLTPAAAANRNEFIQGLQAIIATQV